MKKLIYILAFILGALAVSAQVSKNRLMTTTYGWYQRVVPTTKYLDSTFASFWMPVGNAIATNTNFIGSTTNRSLLFRTNNTQKMKLDSNGVLLVGTNNAGSSLLHIARFSKGTGTVDIGQHSSGVASIWLNQNTPSTTNYALNGTSSATQLNSTGGLYFNIGNSTIMEIGGASGYINKPFRVGSAVAPTATLDVTGTMSVSSTATVGGLAMGGVAPTANNLIHVASNQNSESKFYLYNLSSGAGAGAALRLGNNSNDVTIIQASSGNSAYTPNALNFYQTTTGGFDFRGSSNTSLFRLTDAGNATLSGSVSVGGNGIFGTVSAGSSHTFHTGSSGFLQGLKIMELPSNPGVCAFYGNQTTPSTSNYNIAFQTTATNLNASSDVYVAVGNSIRMHAESNNTNFVLPVSIGNASEADPNASAVLDVVSTTKGFLQPRMTTAQKNAISSPATGLAVYDTDLKGIFTYNGATWEGEIKGNATLDFGDLPTQSNEDLTITVTGAAVGDPVYLGTPASWLNGITFSAWVSATNTVTVRHNNYSSGNRNPASGTYYVIVRKQ